MKSSKIFLNISLFFKNDVSVYLLQYFQNGGIGQSVNTADVPNVISTEIAVCTSSALQTRFSFGFASAGFLIFSQVCVFARRQWSECRFNR